VTLLGIDAAKERVAHLAGQTRAHLDMFGERAATLRASVDFVLDRTS
jgi:farnesyl diphosphate synthase